MSNTIEGKLHEIVPLAMITIFYILTIVVTLLNSNITGLDGHVGTIDHRKLWSQLDPISNTIYWLGDWGCHQQTSRSIIIGTSQMPFCIRETALFLGTITSWMILIITNTKSANSRLIIGISLTLITGIEWIAKANTGFDHLEITAISGILSGAGIGIIGHEYCTRLASRGSKG